MSVAYPEGVARHWNDGRRLLQEKTRELGTNDVEYLTEFVHSFECTGRVFGAGFSNGGHMIYRLLHEAPGLFDAALVIAATQPTPENFLPAPPTADRWRPTPLLLIHGESDPIAPMAGGTVRGGGFGQMAHGVAVDGVGGVGVVLGFIHGSIGGGVDNQLGAEG